MSDLFSDAFKDDRESVIYGQDIFDDRVELHYRDFKESFPSVRCNDVSFLKIEELDSQCRKIVAVANTYICYSVTAKRNLLRLIDSITGEKSILRAHEGNIADIQVSPIDHGFFGSVDTAESEAFPHTIIWKRGSKNIEFVQLASLSLRANLIRAHPTQSNIWAISDGKHLAVFNTDKIPSTNISYSSFPIHYSAGNDLITDVAFTQDGHHIFATIQRQGTNQSEIQLWKLLNHNSPSDSVLTGQEKLHTVYTQFSTQIIVENLFGFNTFGNYFITISSISNYSFVNSLDDNEDDGNAAGVLNYEIKIWKFMNSSTLELLLPPQLVQCIVLHLPEFKSKLPKFQSSSLKNSHLECSIVVEPKHQHYLVVSSRKSRYSAILAINSNYLNTLTGLTALSSSASGDLGQIIYHLTLVDFTVPIVSMDVLNVVAREHHSSEEDEHVEISCYQENKGDPGSSSIQQYHMTVPSLYDQKKYLNNLENHAVNEIKGRTILNLLNSVNAPSVNTSALQTQPLPSVIGTPSPSSAGSAVKRISSIDGDVPKPASTTPRTLQPPVSVPISDSKVEPTPESVTPTTLTVDKDALQKLQQTKPVEGLKKLDSSLLFSNKTPTTPVPPVESLPTSSQKNVSDLPDFLKRTPGQNVNILSMLGKAAANPQLPQASPATTEKKKVEVAKSKEEKTPAPVSAPSKEENPQSAVKLVEPTPSTSRTEVRSLPEVQTPSPTLQPTSLLPTLNQDAVYSLLLEMKQEMAALRRTVSSQAEVVHHNDKKGIKSDHHESKTAASSSASVSQAADFSKLKDDIVKELHVIQHKSMLHTVQILKTHIDNENKKAVDSFQQMKQEIVQQVQESITTKFLPIITTKVKETIKESTKESVKLHLADSFRNAFENSLLPAFQTGVDRLFAQINLSFENGLKSLILETENIQQQNIRSNEDLENEVKLLQDKVIVLETAIHELSLKLTGVVLTGSHREGENGNEKEEEPVAQTPADLLKQGLVEEAVRLALEMKDVDATLNVLAELTPAKVNSSCSNIVKLCITQQLAADMSVNLPVEGVGKRIDWIKNLLLSLIKIPKHEMESDHKLNKNFRIMIQAVLESIQSGRNIIAAAQYDNGEENPIEIPPSVETDLQLLEFLIQTRM